MNQKILVEKILTPIERFLKLQISSGIVLLFATLLALFIANSSFYEAYKSLLHYPLSIGIGDYTLKMSLHHWINDGLMVIFFFLVGLELKREIVIGSLSSKKEIFLPLVAAFGGMVVPALIYTFFNINSPTIVGWGIPMATDIAFALGILAFVSRQVPLTLKIFLLALATIDDLGAILVIAFFYSEQISGFWLGVGALTVFLTFSFRQLRVQNLLVYIVCGMILWFAILNSGIHATIAGVILGLLAPVRPFLNKKKEKINEKLQQLISEKKPSTYQLEETRNLLSYLRSPAQFLIDYLHRFVIFFVVPVFAFFNSGVNFGDQFNTNDFLSSPVFSGIFLGLLIGKPLGVFFFSWVAVKMKWTQWPAQVLPIHILGIGFLAGIGFTMALFISSLSLDYDMVLSSYSKTSIFLASLLAGIVGFGILKFYGKKEA